jgi:hypothetical protein
MRRIELPYSAWEAQSAGPERSRSVRIVLVEARVAHPVVPDGNRCCPLF